MTTSPFQVQLEESMAALEQISAELERTDPDDLARWAPLLERRGAATAQLTTAVAGGARPIEPARLAAIAAAGEVHAERLRLTRAATVAKLRELYRAGMHARVMACEVAQHAPPPAWELEA